MSLLFHAFALCSICLISIHGKRISCRWQNHNQNDRWMIITFDEDRNNRSSASISTATQSCFNVAGTLYRQRADLLQRRLCFLFSVFFLIPTKFRLIWRHLRCNCLRGTGNRSSWKCTFIKCNTEMKWNYQAFVEVNYIARFTNWTSYSPSNEDYVVRLELRSHEIFFDTWISERERKLSKTRDAIRRRFSTLSTCSRFNWNIHFHKLQY